MKNARTLTFMLTTLLLAGCGGGGGGSSHSAYEGHFVGTYTTARPTSGSIQADITSGDRLAGTFQENGSERHGAISGRIVKGKILGSFLFSNGDNEGFNGSAQIVGNVLTLNIKLLDDDAHGTVSLNRQ